MYPTRPRQRCGLAPVRLFGVLALAVGALAGVPAGWAQTDAAPLTPARLFGIVSSGMVKIVTPCAKGLFVGSGFVVGPRTIVTAIHVLKPPGGGACKLSAVKQEGTGSAALIDQYDRYISDDLAVAHLSAPLNGFYFAIAPKGPSVGTRVEGLGYSLGNPLSFNQGTIVSLAQINQIDYIGMNLLGGHGSSGGPILNLKGQVVGLTQGGLTNGVIGVVLSINLALDAPGGKALCQGVAKLSPSTLCGTEKASKLTTSAGGPVGKPLAKTAPPTLAAPSNSARAYNAQTIGDKANHIPSPPIESGREFVEVPQWNGYLRLALIANQDPYGRRYQATYVRCWSPAAFRTASDARSAGQVFRTTTGPLGFYAKGSAWVNVTTGTCSNGARAARGQLTPTTVVALASILHETFNRQGIKDEGDLACLGAIGVWEAVNRHVGLNPANRAWALLLDWYVGHLSQTDLGGFKNCVARFNKDWNG